MENKKRSFWEEVRQLITKFQMKKVRIIERTGVKNNITYVIQQKHFLFRWWWVDAWVNSLDGTACVDYFNTYEEAKQNLCYFDGSSCKDRVVA